MRLSDFLLATCLYILPNMLMIVSVYSLVSLLCKSPLPAVPLLLLYIVYSNMGSRNAEGIYGYDGRPLAIMVRFPGGFFDTSPPPMAALALTFCADTYTQEIISRRSEIWRLCPMKRRVCAIYRRMAIQEVFLLFVAAAGYGLFFLFQNPRTDRMGTEGPAGEIGRFLIYVAAVAVTLGFWGLLSNLLSCLFRNMWVGIGDCLILWLITNSSFGDKYLGVWNLFSYTFRELEDGGDFRWIYGKMVCICIGILAAAALPGIMKRQDR